MFANVVVGAKPGQDLAELTELARKAAQPPARVHLVTVVQVTGNNDESHKLQSAEEQLVGAAEELAALGYDVTREARSTLISVSTELVVAAQERAADLVVIGQRRRTAVGKALLGSDAQRILLGSPCPVLIASAGD